MITASTCYADDIAAVRTRLRQLERTLAAKGDSQAWFVAMYLTTTNRCKWLVEGITQPQHPRYAELHSLDPALIRNIVVCFEPRYTRRLNAFQQGCLAVDDPWHPVFRNAARLSPFSVMLLGAYTHIAFDLPMVLAHDLDDGTPLYDADNPLHVSTFQQLNYWFSLDIGRVAGRVCRVSAGMGLTGSPALVSPLRSRRWRHRSLPLWRRLLDRSRRRAVRDAHGIRRNSLDEPQLGRRVARNNRLMAGVLRTGLRAATQRPVRDAQV